MQPGVRFSGEKNTTSSTKVGLRGSAQQPLTPFTEGNKLFGGLGP